MKKSLLNKLIDMSHNIYSDYEYKRLKMVCFSVYNVVRKAHSFRGGMDST